MRGFGTKGALDLRRSKPRRVMEQWQLVTVRQKKRTNALM